VSSKSIPLSSYQLRLLAVLVLVNFVNFAARWIFIPLIPMLRGHLGVTDEQLGSLQTWLLLVLAVGSIPFGFLADRFSRKAIIVFGIVCWSLATLAGGFAGSFLFLVIARAFVGVGEAAYAPAAQSMISGAFPAETRASAQAIFASGMLVGGAAGQVLGGLIAPRYGWQAALFVIAAVGLLPVIAMMTLQEPPRGPASETCPILKLLTVPAFLAMIAAASASLFPASPFLPGESISPSPTRISACAKPLSGSLPSVRCAVSAAFSSVASSRIACSGVSPLGASSPSLWLSFSPLPLFSWPFRPTTEG